MKKYLVCWIFVIITVAGVLIINTADLSLIGKPRLINNTTFGPPFCNIHNVSTQYEIFDNPILFECIEMKYTPAVNICLYPDREDSLSAFIRQHRAFDEHVTVPILAALDKYPSAGLIDIGANLGSQSLVAAKRGRNVVAVEAETSTVWRLHKSIMVNNIQGSFILVHNAISNVRGRNKFYLFNKNQGLAGLHRKTNNFEQISCIHMDDLLETVTFDEAIIKMDIEGSEHYALQHSRKLFEKLSVHYIFMEFDVMRRQLVHSRSVIAQSIQNMTLYLRTMGFVPRYLDSKTVFRQNASLRDEDMTTWPVDIVWVNTSIAE